MEVVKPVEASVAGEQDSKDPASFLSSLHSIVGLLEQAVKLKETRLSSGRVLRLTSTARKNLTGQVLHSFISSCLAQEVETKPFLLAHAQKVCACV